MVYTIVIVLIAALILLTIVINAVQQHKEKANAERRAEIAKFKAIVEDTDEVIVNSTKIPLSKALLFILNKRVINALKSMQELSPQSMEVKRRLNDAIERANNLDVNEKSSSEEQLRVPDNERQIIDLLHGIKKLRVILRSENSKATVDPQIFAREERRLEQMQLRINIESLMKRAHAAHKNNMLGSARQYLEKVIALISSQAFNDEFSTNRKREAEELLHAITAELKNANAASRKKKAEDETDDLDVLFQPKKKW